jgi:CO/xanthine dehydrogenase FAD-binding subunit
MAIIRDIMPAFELFQPATVGDALGLLDQHGSDAWVLAGGLDSFDWLKDRIKRPKVVIDLSQVSELRGVKEVNGGLEIGAMTTLTEVVRNPIVKAKFGILAQGAELAASPQIRNQGTLGGNVSQDARCWYYRGGHGLLGKGKNGSNAFARCVATVAKANRQAEQQGRLNPARTCRALRTQLTLSLFAQTYGKNANGRNAFGKCVSTTAKTQAHNEVSASSTCKAEQTDPNFGSTHGGQTFGQTYGTSTDQSNAFGMCVSSTANAASITQEHAIVRAALACKAEKKSGPAAFKAKYKTFGRCVATLAKSK